MTDIRVRSLRDGFTLSKDRFRIHTEEEVYQVHAPLWRSQFIADSGSVDDEKILERQIDRAVDEIVDGIFRNPVVKKELDKMLAFAREQGYYKAIQELQTGRLFT